VLTAYSRVTVVSGSRKVDLALPNALPLADVLPQVLRFCLTADDAHRPQAWSLARLGGVPLPLTQTLAEVGVGDGEVLELRGQTAAVRPALVEDVRDAVEDSVDVAGGWWTPSTTLVFALVASSVALGYLALVMLLDPKSYGGDDVSEVVSACTATLVVAGMTGWAAVRSVGWVAQACAAALVLWGVAFGTSIGRAADLDDAILLLLAVGFAALAAVSARLLSRAATALAAGVGVLAVPALTLGIVGLTAVEPMQVGRLAPVLALLATGVLPRLALSVGGIASADYRIRNVARLSDADLVARYRQSNGLIIGGLAGISLIVVWGGYLLTFSDEAWDRYLGLSIGVVALLRSRVFSRTPHMVALRSVGVLVVLLQGARLVADVPELRPWFAVMVAAAAAVLVAISSLGMSGITRARVKRVLNIVEFLVVVDMVAVAVGAMGLYAYVAEVM